MDHVFYNFISLLVGEVWGMFGDLRWFLLVVMGGLMALKIALQREWDLGDWMWEYEAIHEEQAGYEEEFVDY
jgi:hypothetical protein